MAETKCKWLSDDFSEICVNGDCPACADFCPTVNYPGLCRYEEMEVEDAKKGKYLMPNEWAHPGSYCHYAREDEENR